MNFLMKNLGLSRLIWEDYKNYGNFVGKTIRNSIKTAFILLLFLPVISCQVSKEASGLEKVTEEGKTGWRLIGVDPDAYENIGKDAIDLSIGDALPIGGAIGLRSVAMGTETTASGQSSTAMGSRTIASGLISTSIGASTTAFGIASIAIGSGSRAFADHSTAMGWETETYGDKSTTVGNQTIAHGNSSIAMGFESRAFGSFSTAMGENTTARGKTSTSMGKDTKAESYTSLAIGKNNIGGGNADNWMPLDPLFEIGNGVARPNNAFTVLKNGKVGIGEHKPTAALGIKHNSSLLSGHINLKEDDADYARINFYNTTRPTDFWTIAGRLGSSVADDRLNFYNSNVGDILSIRGNGSILVSGSVVHSSDGRLKKDVTLLSYGLNEILLLQPVSYNWKNKEQKHKSLGLIAQEVQPIIKELVHIDSDKDKTLSLSYTELVPILIKAIQEQQAVIDGQHKDITRLSAEVSATKRDITNLLTRVIAMEKEKMANN